MTARNFIGRFGIFILLSALAFSSCSHGGKTILLVYSPHGKDMLSDFEHRFEALHPDVDVRWLDMSSQDIFDRIRTERANPQADVWWGAPSTIFMRAEREDLLEAYRPSWAAHVPPMFRSDSDYWYGTFVTPEVIAYNSRLLNATTAPQDWNDLVDPKWKGKIILRYPLASGTLRTIFSSILANSVHRYGNSDEGFTWLRKLDANTKEYTPDPTQLYLKLAREEASVTLWDMPDIVLESQAHGYPFGYVFPKSGTVLLCDGIAIVRGTRHEALAKEFYEFVTSQQSLLIEAEKYYRIPARNDIPRDKLPEWIRTTNCDTLNVDWNLISQYEADWMRAWDEQIKGRMSRP